MMIAVRELGRRQPSSFDGGGGGGGDDVKCEEQQRRRTSKSTRLRSVLGIPLVWIALIILQIRVTQAKIGYFWHITDLHFDSFYSTKGDTMRSCWHTDHPQSNQARPGRFGDYNCDSPWALIESAMHTMKSRQGDNVEFVLWTGDGLSHSTRRLMEEQRHKLLQNITELLRRTFPSQFVFPVLGHEDGQATNFRHLVDLWQTWLPSEALQTFERGGYYTIEQRKSRLRIIILNTNFMRHGGRYTQSHLAAVRQRVGSNGGGGAGSSSEAASSYYYHHGNYYHNNNNNGYHATVNGMERNGGAVAANGAHVSALSGADSHESQRQWNWLEEVLEKSSLNKETVYIVGHIPPGSDERDQAASLLNGHQFFSQKNNLRYLDLVRKYASIIQGQFFGHLHSDSFRIVYNEMGKPVSWMMMAPSVTPKKQNVGSNNPGLRLYKFETDTGQVLDYSQFFLNLTSANESPEAIWQPEYNLTSHYYGLSEVSAVALHNLADRFTNADDPLFAKYLRANSVRYSTQSCDNGCALNHFCAITRLDYREYRQCLETTASELSSHGRSIHGGLRRGVGGSNSSRWLSTLTELVVRLLPILMVIKSCRGRVIDWHSAGARKVVCLMSSALTRQRQKWGNRSRAQRSGAEDDSGCAKLVLFHVRTATTIGEGAAGASCEFNGDGGVLGGTGGGCRRKDEKSRGGAGEMGFYAKTTYLGKVFCFVSVTLLLLFYSSCCYLLKESGNSSSLSCSSSCNTSPPSTTHPMVNGEDGLLLPLLNAMNFSRILRGCHKVKGREEENEKEVAAEIQLKWSVQDGASAAAAGGPLVSTVTAAVGLVTSLVLVSSMIMVIRFCSRYGSNNKITTMTRSEGGHQLILQEEEEEEGEAVVEEDPSLLMYMQICQDYIIKTLIKMTGNAKSGLEGCRGRQRWTEEEEAAAGKLTQILQVLGDTVDRFCRARAWREPQGVVVV